MMRILYIKVELNNKTIRVLVQSIFKIRTKFKQAVKDMMKIIKLLKNKLRKTNRKILANKNKAIIPAIIILQIQRLKKYKKH